MKDSKRLNGKSKLIILGITIVIFLLTILFAMTNSKYDKGIINLFDKQKDTVDFVITIRDSMDSSKLIVNAKFAIWEMTIENDAYVFSPPYDADENVLGTPEIIDGETVYTFESNENGQIITKLRNGIYKLEQISTIEGYDTLKNAINFYFGVGEGLGVTTVVSLFSILQLIVFVFSALSCIVIYAVSSFWFNIILFDV